MSNITDKKHFSYQITERFLFAMDRIVGAIFNGKKVTLKEFAKTVNMTSSNLKRLRDFPESNTVTVEAIGRLCHYYKISSSWLISNIGDPYNNDELLSPYKDLKSRLNELEILNDSIRKSLAIIKKNNKR